MNEVLSDGSVYWPHVSRRNYPQKLVMVQRMFSDSYFSNSVHKQTKTNIHCFNSVFSDEGQVHHAEGIEGVKWEVIIPTCQR